ncbi:MAG: hypothetical protein V1892_01945 [bacterium]
MIKSKVSAKGGSASGGKSQKSEVINQGAILVSLLVFTSIFIILAGGLLSLVVYQYKLNKYKVAKAQAIHVAEAGINYYRWHLAHEPDDFQDGTGGAGPYVHDFRDPQGNIIGQFSLIITPMPNTTIVSIQSTGWLLSYPNIKRIILAQYGIPALSAYAVVANADMRFGSGTQTYGPIHSNGGIRFDGVAHNIVTSARQTYVDPDDSQTEFGVHTHTAPQDPQPPAAVPQRTDVFQAGRKFPVTTVDFNGFTTNLADLKTLAKNNGLYLDKSNKRGYWLHFNSNQTVDIYIVKTVTDTCGSTDTDGIAQTMNNPQLGEPLPANGIIFIEDKVWVDGQINNSRLTLVAAREPLASGDADIIINHNLLYTNKNGSDVLGLIAQRNITVGLYSDDNLEIDASLVAKSGRIGRYYFTSSCSSTYYERNSIALYGSLATYNRYGFSWSCGETYCSGYQNRTITYDGHLTFSPPPSFPTSGEYTFISWRELNP